MLSTIIGIIIFVIVVILVVQFNQPENFRRRGGRGRRHRGRRGRRWWRRRFRPFRRRRYLGAPIVLNRYPYYNLYNNSRNLCLDRAEFNKNRCLVNTNNIDNCLAKYRRDNIICNNLL